MSANISTDDALRRRSREVLRFTFHVVANCLCVCNDSFCRKMFLSSVRGHVIEAASALLLKFAVCILINSVHRTRIDEESVRR